MRSVRKPFSVRTKEDFGGIPEDSDIQVERILKRHYVGIWSSMFGTYPVKVPKKIW